MVDHSEFFRADPVNRYGLIWRRAYDASINADTGEPFTEEEGRLSFENNILGMTRPALSVEYTRVLIETAISLHAGEIANEQNSRWWQTPIVGLGGLLVGLAAPIITVALT